MQRSGFFVWMNGFGEKTFLVFQDHIGFGCIIQNTQTTPLQVALTRHFMFRLVGTPTEVKTIILFSPS